MHVPPLMLWTASEWDIALTIGLFVLGGSMSLTAWLFKKRMEAYDKHIDDSNYDKQGFAVLESRVTNHFDDDVRRFAENASVIEANRRTLHWLGDCMMTLGAKLNVDLPKRPQ